MQGMFGARLGIPATFGVDEVSASGHAGGEQLMDRAVHGVSVHDDIASSKPVACRHALD